MLDATGSNPISTNHSHHSTHPATDSTDQDDDAPHRNGDNASLGLPPPVSPFRPNLDALKLDISDDEDGIDGMEELWANGGANPSQMDGGDWAPPSASASPASALGIADLDTPPMHGGSYVEFPSDGESPPYPSPRPRASTLAQSSNGISPNAAPPLPPLNPNRQFLRAASQPTNVLGGSPTQRADTAKSGVKRPLVPLSNKILPTRPTVPDITPLTMRKPMLSASAGKFLSRGGNGRISPPRRVLVKERDRDNEEGETEDEDRAAAAKAYPIAPRTSERNNLLRPRKEATPELKGRSLASFGRSASSPDGILTNARRNSPTNDSPTNSTYDPNAGNNSPTSQPQHQLATSTVAGASTSSLSTTASSTRGHGAAGSVKARLLDWKSSLGSWSKGARSRPPIPGISSRPSLDSLHRALGGGDSARPSIDSARPSFDRPSFDTVRPALGLSSSATSALGTIPASGDSERGDISDIDDQQQPPEHRRNPFANEGRSMSPEPGEGEEPEPMGAPRVYVSNGGARGYEARSASAAGWNDRERGVYQSDRPGTSSGYYNSQSQQPQSSQVRAVQQAHEHVRRTSDTLRPSGELVPRSPNTGTIVASVAGSMRHKRSPTAPSPRTTSSSLSAKEKENQRTGQTWAAGQDPRIQERADAAGVAGSYGADVGGYAGMGREELKAIEMDRERLREVENRARVADVREREREERGEAREREARSGSAQGLAVVQQAVTVAPSASVSKRDRFVCNKQEYTVIDCIGRGGSSKVYKVISPANKVYALKRVRLDSKVDEETMRGYVNEMQLLKRLDGNERIIKLVDSQAQGKGNRYLMMVMELGEIDLAKLLQERQGQLLQPHWIAIYWQQMLEAVQTIHEEKIVHSDLKPANFVLVKGSLKLIDFGIAKAIANDTTNIQREHQVGTLNYMSPESIEETQTANGRRLKLGRASDVWSLGCILYQMIYGRPPFYSIPGPVPKLRAISDPNHVIDYPALSIPTVPSSDKDGSPRQIVEWATPVPPDVVETLKGCLTRDPKQRRTIPELLDDPWLRSWRHTSVEGGEAPKLKDNEAIVTEAWLKQIIEHASREAIENGALDDDAVTQMAQNLLPALRLANTRHPAYKQFC
ncbi:Dual-specificity kinase, spindle pole body (SPB) duplication and spindle checkpoint function [Ceratobasidium sp. 414]|nr:Dual-specificity kinase, spindle pole body (SPB) duplication and spindle checkpoint function [Ceratobasidium sp. 414]